MDQTNYNNADQTYQNQAGMANNYQVNNVPLQNYNVDPAYQGSRNVCVPTRMYSKNLMLKALHVKSKRYLCVNMDLGRVTFHKTCNPADRDPKDEIPFNLIKAVDADVTNALKGKFYLYFITDGLDLKFKFKNAHDFMNVVEALRCCIYDHRPVYAVKANYTTYVQTYNANPSAYTNPDLNRSISSDDARDYQHEDQIITN